MSIKEFIQKKKWIFILVGIIILSLIVLYFVFRGTKGLSKPESIVYDAANERYLISNSGNGSIVSMNLKGKVQPLVKGGMISPKGLYLDPPFLYVADVTNLHAIDLMNQRLVASYPIDGAIALNDIAVDANGDFYITDTAANALFIFNLETKNLQKISSPLLNAPNGIVYDRPRNQMLIVGYGNHASILNYDIGSRTISVLMETVYSQLDGIAIDELGRIYFSSWKEKVLIMIPQEQNRFIPIVKGIKSPADFTYNPQTKELRIPLLNRNRIYTHKLAE